MKWVGLTGGIATGKSTVKKLFEGRGFPVIDADLIAHQVSEVGTEGYKKVLLHFGNRILNEDQSLNRKKLGEIIFNDTKQRLILENFLHPLIQIEVQRQKEIAQKNAAALCFYDVPLLFEKDLKKNFDCVVLVWCDPAIQKLRLQLRNLLSEAEIESRIQSQMRMSVKLKNADHCIDNSTDLASLTKQVDQLLIQWASLSQVGSSSPS